MFTLIKKAIVNVYKVVVKGTIWFIDLITLYLSIINNKLLCIIDNKKEYESLSPKDDLPKDNSYIKALKESIEDPKRRNIAVSGIYGSGKSSIIESFKTNHKEYKYLDISLATFVSSGNDNLENELERNILNQIFYKVKHSKMPYSRFRKIKNIKLMHIFKVFSIYGLLAISLALIIKPELIETFASNIKKLKKLLSGIPILGDNINLSVFIILVVCIVTMLYVSIFFIQFILSKFTINKIQDKDGTIEVGKIGENETFNKYLDEIMYFFESAKYDVVFFEDLDRFNNLEIFTKLRALNTLINNSESIKRKVTFVYAIKDELFFIDDSLKKANQETEANKNDNIYIYKDRKDMNKNRTKFFDFIIPVIPVVNGENSYEILSKKIEGFNKLYGKDKKLLDDSLISDISFFIDDMRLLTNIYNEFLIYYRRLIVEGENGTLNVNNLFAIITYKNLYPVDFTKLQNQDGMVYRIFDEKNDIAMRVVDKLNEEIEECKFKIMQLEKEIAENIEELHDIYSTKWQAKGIDEVSINGSNWYSVSQLINVEVLENIKNADMIKYKRSGYYSSNSIEFVDLMTIYGEKRNYYDRFLSVKSKGNLIADKIKFNKNRIQILDDQIKEFKDSSIKTLMKDDRFFKNIHEDIKKEPIILRLLTYGYIDEMYPYYTLYFYEGKLTKKDFEFVQSVLNNKPLDSNFELTNINNILEKISIDDFKTNPILNYNLLEYLLIHIEDNNNKLRIEKIIECLSELNEEDMKFIVYFINKNENNSKFIKILCEKVHEFWNKVYNSNYIPQNAQDYILELILKYCSIDNILEQNNGGYIKDYIESKDDFIKSIAIKIDNSKLKEILIELNIKLKDISKDIVDEIKNDSNEDYNNIIDIIYSNNLYEISSNMISIIVTCKNVDLKNENNINLNYSSIQNYNLKFLKEYIDSNINIYIKNIFLEDSIKENTETIIEIINNEGVDIDLLNNIIRHKEFEIIDINEVSKTEVWYSILENLKVKSSWANILSYYHNEGTIDEKLSKFINNSKVYNSLVEDELYRDELSEEKTKEIDLFVEKLIKSNDISDEVINLLSCKLGGAYDEFDFNGLSNERVIILIDKKLVNLNENIYKALKSSHDRLHIHLVEVNIEEFMQNKIDDFDSKDLELILKSFKISDENIYNIMKTYKDNIDINDNISECLYDRIEKIIQEREIDYELIENIMKTQLKKEKKIKLVAYQVQFLNKEYTSKLLENIDSTYKELLDLSSKHMYLSNSNENELLLKSLKNKEFISSFKPNKGKLLVHRKKSEK